MNPKPLLLPGPLLLGAVPSQACAASRPATMSQTPLTRSPEDEKDLRAHMADLDLRWKQRDVPAYLALVEPPSGPQAPPRPNGG